MSDIKRTSWWTLAAVALAIVASIASLLLVGFARAHRVVPASEPLARGALVQQWDGLWGGGEGLVGGLFGSAVHESLLVDRRDPDHTFVELLPTPAARRELPDLFGLRVDQRPRLGRWPATLDEHGALVFHPEGVAHRLHIAGEGALLERDGARAVLRPLSPDAPPSSLIAHLAPDLHARVVLVLGFMAAFVPALARSALPTLLETLGIAGVLWWMFWRGARVWRRRVQPDHAPTHEQYQREISATLLGLPIAGAMAMVAAACYYAGFTELYTDVALHGWGWWCASIVVVALAHDTFFYWVHRLLHWRGFYAAFHWLHHETRTPTPWTTLSFTPQEGMLHALFALGIACLIPLHAGALALYFVLAAIRAAIGHLGVELYPACFARGPLRMFATVTHHDIHHSDGARNLGLYLRFWDIVMGTEHPDYLRRFEQVTRAGDARASDLR